MMPASFKIPMERFWSEKDPFRLGSAPITANRREYRRSGCPRGNRRSPLPALQSEVRALSIIGPAGGKAPRQGKSPRPASGSPLTLGSILVAKNLHLTNFLLIFHGDSTGS